MKTVEGVTANTEEMDEGKVRIPLMLLNISFEPGHCLERIRHMKDPMLQDIALTEYYYFTCQHERAVAKAVGYLYHDDLKTQIGAWLIYTFGNMALGNAEQVRTGMEHLRSIAEQGLGTESTRNMSLLLLAMKMMLHIPILDEERQKIVDQEDFYDEAGRLLICYLAEQEAWKRGEYERVIGGVDAIALLSKNKYPLFFLYLYLTAASAAMNLRDVHRAELYFEKAWELVKADGFYGAIGEMHGHIQPFVEKKIRRENPEAYKQIMEVSRQYCSGWHRFVRRGGENEDEMHMPEMLTGMEDAVAQLARLKWSNQEIADYLEISLRTVKYHMTSIFNKLNIQNRKELIEKFSH